jgi:FkbM family methyltransferase
MKRYSKTPNCQIKNLTDLYMDAFGYKTDGFFVEVGAFDGVLWSNTLTLVNEGWSGIYFEPHEDQFNALNANHGDNPDLHLRKMALSNYHGLAELYLGGSISTISEKTKDLYLEIPGFSSTGLAHGISDTVEVSTLDTELDGMAPVGFEVLIVDVEGSEMDVLDGFSIEKYMPVLAVIETHDKFPDERLNSKAALINEYMKGAGYTLLQSDIINSVYVR